MVGILNSALNALGEVLAGAVSWLPAWLALFVLAVLTAAGSLVVFRWTSDQQGIRAAKSRVKARLLAVLIFRRDPVVAVRSLLRAFLGTLANLRFLVKPMAVLLIPLVLLFVQLDHRYGYQGLDARESVTIRVHLAEGADPDPVELGGEGLSVETPGVRVEDRAARLFEVDFRVRPVAGAETAALTVTWPGGSVVRDLALGDVPGRLVAPAVPSRGFFDQLLNPGAAPVPADSPLRRIEIDRYEVAGHRLVGIEFAWWVLYLLFLVVALVLLKRPLRVDF